MKTDRKRSLFVLSLLIVLVLNMPAFILPDAFAFSGEISHTKLVSIEQKLADEAQYAAERYVNNLTKADIRVTLTNFKIDKINRSEVGGIITYSAEGRASFKLEFRHDARDKLGKIIHNGGYSEEKPFWFRSEIREDPNGTLSISRQPRKFFLYDVDPATYEAKPSR